MPVDHSQRKVKIKFCGITRPDDLQAAQELGADAVGFVLWDKSKRAVTLDKVKELSKNLDGSSKVVFLFVNPQEELVKAALKIVPYAILQFHGDETPEFCTGFGAPWMKAVHISNSEDLKSALERYHLADYILCDTPSMGYGGSGKTFDWSLITASNKVKIVLAGGLNSENVREAIIKVRPFAVDVSSGIEIAPGVKSSVKMRSFIKAVLSANNYLKNS